ncbi:zinc ABC transporter substrate-binding protein [Stutzerimonas tarimensis]|uniref:High-affinity zinc uptake system protein ZnuA n=1 Tax=Stutzerimonas tarimensis TaxID=1507735 RepID=A0ABV7T686_9GAMM
MFRSFVSALSLSALLVVSASAQAEVRLLTSIKPLQLIAAAVQDGMGEPGLLLPPGASAHHHSLRPSDLRRLGNAELFYWIGPDMEGFLIDVLKARQVPALAVQELPGLQLRYFHEREPAEADHGQSHQGQSHGQAHGHDHDHDHKPGSLDAHLWLLPANARVIAARMAADLGQADPANAEHYAENLQAFGERLDALDERLRQRIVAVQGKPYFVFHQAYDYLEAAYGLQHEGVFNLSGEVQPGARHVAQLRQRLEQTGPSCVFSEPPLRPRLVDTLTAGLPVQSAELDPLGTETPATAQGYEQFIEGLADDLAGCLEKL